jgi:RND superfamily putative drug exporter
MRALASLVSGRRTKWLLPAVWIVLIVVFSPIGQKLGDETSDETSAFLPKSAESTEVNGLLSHRFASGQTVNGLIVYQRSTGLTAADRRKIAADARRVQGALPLIGKPVVPFTDHARGLVSRNGQVAYTVLTFRDDYDKLGDWGKDVRDITGEGSGSLQVFVTGDAGFTADFAEVFGSIDASLLAVTILLVLVLLGAIYRSPLIAIMPLLVVFAAYSLAQGLIYLYAKSGATVSSNSTTILVVLMFGLGTDYCLLLLSRYREELHTHEDKHQAIARAVRRAGPAIFASGLTVAISMLVLLVADTRSIGSLGPVAAIGVGCVLLVGLTLLPALLAIGGRGAFWPRRRSVAYVGPTAVAAHRGWWRRLGDRVVSRPAAALAVTVAAFGAGAFGLAAYKEDYSITNVFKKPVDSVDGFRVLERAFPAGTSNPTTVLVERGSGPVRRSDAAVVRQRLESVPEVATVGPIAELSRDRRIARLELVLRDDPYTEKALDSVPEMRDRLENLPDGVHALLGSGTAVQYDFNQAVASDTEKIVPLALLVIAVILGALLVSIVAPLVIILTVLASFFGTLGMALVFFRYVVGDAGVDASLPVFAFIFLVALGVDYTIFLMSRVREESRRHGTREGTLRALAATGPVITSAGLILAGTFSVLMTLPVTFAFNIGFLVAVGVLLDTFVVRTIMLPAAVEIIGEPIWWPSDQSRGARAFREDAAGAEAPAR